MSVRVYKLDGLPPTPDMRRALGADFLDIAAEVDSGACECFLFHGCGHVVTRIESHPSTNRRTLVIVGGALYENTHESAGRVVVPKLIEAAAANACHYVRAHSRRDGMGRYLRQFGFTEQERVYGLELVKQ